MGKACWVKICVSVCGEKEGEWLWGDSEYLTFREES